VFNISDAFELRLSTQLPEFENAKAEIDPQIWYLIKPQVTSIWIEAVKSMFGSKIASTSTNETESTSASETESTSTSGTDSTSLLRLFYEQRSIITISPDGPAVGLSVSESSSCTDEIASAPFGFTSLSKKLSGDCSSSQKIAHSYCSPSSLKWRLED
jgi:hypothetical protein